MGAPRFYRRARVVSRSTGATRFLWRSRSANIASLRGVDAAVLRLWRGAAIWRRAIHRADIIRARSHAARSGTGVGMATLGRGPHRPSHIVWRLRPVLRRVADRIGAAWRLAVRLGDSGLRRRIDRRVHLFGNAGPRQTLSAIAHADHVPRRAVLAGVSTASARASDHARPDGREPALSGSLFQGSATQSAARNYQDLPPSDPVERAENPSRC